MATTKVYKVVPAAAAGISRATPGTTAWSNSAYTQMVASITGDFWVTGLIAVPWTPAAAVDTTYEFEIDLAAGASGSEVVLATFPGAIRFDTLVGPVQTHIWTLPNPKFVVGGSRLAVRAREGTTTARTINGIKASYYQ